MNKSDEQILIARAKDIAVRFKPVHLASEGISVVEFLLFPEQYAIDARYIREVVAIKQITPIPGTPDYVMGVLNYRGKIVAVINLKILLGLKEKGLTEMNKAIILQSGSMEFGLIVDGIIGSSSISSEQIASPPQNLNSRGAEYLTGITPSGSIMLDAGRMLTSNQLIVTS